MGILRISDEGTMGATCHYNQACKREFVEHTLRNVANCRTKVLVLNCNGVKIKMSETCLLRYYERDEHKQVFRCDEFLSCSACNKVRGFELRSREACRFYHNAAVRENQKFYHDAAARENQTLVDLIYRPKTQSIFSNEELSAFVGQIIVREPCFIEITCGWTNRLGDSSVILRINDDGTICAACHYSQGGNLVFICPAKFAKHASSSTNVPNWRTKVWVLNCNGKKIKLSKTCLLKYYKGDEYQRPRNLVSHRDEFLSCGACNKVRRFELRSRDACRFYHETAARENRTCHDMILGRWTCDDLEERSSTPESWS